MQTTSITAIQARIFLVFFIPEHTSMVLYNNPVL